MVLRQCWGKGGHEDLLGTTTSKPRKTSHQARNVNHGKRDEQQCKKSLGRSRVTETVMLSVFTRIPRKTMEVLSGGESLDCFFLYIPLPVHLINSAAIHFMLSLYSFLPGGTFLWITYNEKCPLLDKTLFSNACTRSTKFWLLRYSANNHWVTLSRSRNFKRHSLPFRDDGVLFVLFLSCSS